MIDTCVGEVLGNFTVTTLNNKAIIVFEMQQYGRPGAALAHTQAKYMLG